MNNKENGGKTISVSFTRSASRDARDLMCNDINTFDFFIKRIAKRNQLELKNLPELLVAVDILKMEITYN